MYSIPVIVAPDPKITVIYDNGCANRSLTKGFGFSCVIEWGKNKILFDTGGNRDAFFSNLEKLKIQLTDITQVIFSHHHWDHTVAFKEVLNQINDKVIVYIPSIFSAKLESQTPKK